MHTLGDPIQPIGDHRTVKLKPKQRDNSFQKQSELCYRECKLIIDIT